MKTLVPLIIFAMIAIAFLAALRRKPGEVATIGEPPYFARKPLTEIEQVLYFRIREALPDCIVLSQVAMPALIGVKQVQGRQAAFNRIQAKYVDYVVCLPDFTVVAVVELDDMTHTRPDRVRADTTKDTALRLAGHPIIRIKAHAMPTTDDLRKMFTSGQPSPLDSAPT